MDLFELKSGYLDQIENAAFESQSRLSICKCRFCRIEFLTAKSNESHDNLLCVMGCRERHRKISSAARSRKRNQSTEGKRKKRVLNRRRSHNDDELVSQAQVDVADQNRLQYYRWLIWVIDGFHIDAATLAVFIMSIFEKVRSRGLDKSIKISDILDP